MFLPLICAYLLFAWIQSYNNDQHFSEYLESTNELYEIKKELQDPSLYTSRVDYTPIEELVNDYRSITLYNKNGFILYSSEPAHASKTSGIQMESLYEGLYEFRQGYRTYTYKEPVLINNDIAGFFSVSIAREEWTEEVVHRTYLVSGILLITFILIYVTITYLVNRKLNYRLTGLMGEMSAFAQGQVLKETETNRDEIGMLKRQFYQMRKQIVEANQELEEQRKEKEYMIATLSHDLKTPLTSIRAYAEALEKETGLSTKEKQLYNKIITEKATFMKEMLDDLLTYTLLQSPNYELDVVVVDGEEFFDMLTSDYEPLCQEKNITLHVGAYVSGEYEVHPKEMMRVTDNIVSNAIHHTPENHSIWIGAISSKEQLPSWLFPTVQEMDFDFENNMYMFIQNEGKSISHDHVKQVFDPLFQADQARTKKEEHRTGLGLSITKQIVEKHGGSVHLFSEEGYGVCFVFNLPKYK